MDELYAVYLESLDQDLRVFENETEAQAHYNKLEEAGKAVKMEKFSVFQIIGVSKSNGAAASDPGFWEELRYDNGHCVLVEYYNWHSAPDKEGYYADYSLEW